MYCAFHGVHTPLEAPAHYVRKYDGIIADTDRKMMGGMVNAHTLIHSYTIHDTLYTHTLIHYTLYTIHYTLYTHTLIHYTLYTIHYTLYTHTLIHYTLYTIIIIAYGT
jgi:hypothetical protein